MTRLLALAAAAAITQAPAVARISQQEFKELIAANRVTIVDARDENSFKEAHVPGAIALPVHDATVPTPAARKIIARLKAAKQPVVVYCACDAESSSLRVAGILRDHGVPDARALVGGWVDWFNGGNPLARGK
jgi:rhodanese-related sulfurtransferase